MAKQQTSDRRERARINARDFLAEKLTKAGMNSEKAHREAVKVAQESAKSDERSNKEG